MTTNPKALARLTQSVNRIRSFSKFPNGACIRGLTRADLALFPELRGHSFIFDWDGSRATNGRFTPHDGEEFRSALESSRV